MNKMLKSISIYENILTGKCTTAEELAYFYYLDEWKKNGLTTDEIEKKLQSAKQTIANNIKQLNKEWNTDIRLVEDYHYKVFDQGDLRDINPGARLNKEECYLILSVLSEAMILMANEFDIIKDSILEDIVEKGWRFKVRDNHSFIKMITPFIEENEYESNFKVIRQAIIENKSIKYFEGNNSVIAKPEGISRQTGYFYVLFIDEEQQTRYTQIIERLNGVTVVDNLFNNEEIRIEDRNRFMDFNNKLFFGKSGEETKVVLKISKTEKAMNLLDNVKQLNDYRVLNEDENSRIIEVQVLGIEGIKIWVLTFGKEIEVLEPVELRQSIKDTAFKIINRNKIKQNTPE